MSLRFTRSAFKHRVSRARSLYVLEHYFWEYDVGRGVTLYMGADQNGIDLEIGVAERGGERYVIHAMKVRPQFLAEYRRHLS